MRAFGFAFLLLLLPACDSGSEAAEFIIGGTYQFDDGPSASGLTTHATLFIPTTASGEPFAFTSTFVQTSSGATVTDDQGSGLGSYDHPTVTFTLDGTLATGTVSGGGDRIEIEEPGRDPFIVYVRTER